MTLSLHEENKRKQLLRANTAGMKNAQANIRCCMYIYDVTYGDELWTLTTYNIHKNYLFYCRKIAELWRYYSSYLHNPNQTVWLLPADIRQRIIIIIPFLPHYHVIIIRINVKIYEKKKNDIKFITSMWEYWTKLLTPSVMPHCC